MRVAAAAICLFLALAGCNRAERREGAAPAPAGPATPVGFQHEPGFDAQGFYRPDLTIGPGAMKLAQIMIGAPSDFEAWEGGKREEIFGPILMIFEDPAAAGPVDDTGKLIARIEVRPLAYVLSPGRVAFHGKDDKLGEIDFEGAFDTAALAETKSGGAETKPVLSGQLLIAGQKPVAVKFTRQAGD